MLRETKSVLQKSESVSSIFQSLFTSLLQELLDLKDPGIHGRTEESSHQEFRMIIILVNLTRNCTSKDLWRVSNTESILLDPNSLDMLHLKMCDKSLTPNLSYSIPDFQTLHVGVPTTGIRYPKTGYLIFLHREECLCRTTRASTKPLLSFLPCGRRYATSGTIWESVRALV